MYRISSPEGYLENTARGVRPLFILGRFQFLDTRDASGARHYFVLAHDAAVEETLYFEVDQDVMYEYVAQYLFRERVTLPRVPRTSVLHRTLLDIVEGDTVAAKERYGADDADACRGLDPSGPAMHDTDRSQGGSRT
jgi:hypothetical protein